MTTEDAESTSLIWARYATLLAVGVASTLCLVKLYAWLSTGSAAVFGSLADSTLDLFGSLMAAGAVRYAAMPPDDNHRFGHHKAEALTALGQVALIASSAALVFWESGRRLLSSGPVDNALFAGSALGFSLIMTLFLIAFQTFAIKRSGSIIIRADRAHYLGDVLATLGAIAAVMIWAYTGWTQADAIAGLIAAAFLVSAGWTIAREAIPQLMDEELPIEDRERIVAILSNDPDVRDHHALRTRRAAGRRFIQVDIQIDPNLSFRDAHDISDRIELAIEAAFPDADVIVHPDPAGEARIEARAKIAE